MIGLIPARSGSKRIPNKNIRILGGQPVLAWSILLAKQIYSLNKIVVSTDSVDYAQVAEHYGAEVLMRPPELATDDATDYDVIKHCLEHYPGHYRIVYLRPTTPIREIEVVRRALLDFDFTKYDSLRSAEWMPESAYKCFELQGSELKPFCQNPNMPNHFYPPTLKANGYVDIIKASNIINYNDAFGKRIQALLTPPVTELDTELDFSRLEMELQMMEAYNVHK